MSPIGPWTAAQARAFGDRVVTTHDHRQHPGCQHLCDGLLDRGVVALRLCGHHGGVAEVDDPERGERVDTRFEMGTGWTAGGSNRARREPGAGPVRDELVHRCADDRDIEPIKLRRVLGAGDAPERERPSVIGLFAILAPALHRVKHHRVNVSSFV